jgi:putative SOS response-associated peptidase YedK
MPVILAPRDWALWLGAMRGETGEVLGLLRPRPAEELVAYPVGAMVKSVRNNGPELVEAVGPAIN